MKPIKTILLASGLLTSFSLFAADEEACQNYDVFVMRHLPKEESKELSVNRDPELNSLGKKMALELAELPFMSRVDVGFTTDYRRTNDTIKPSSEKYDFDVYNYDPRNNLQLVERIKQEFCGKSVIIIGHSNTVPAIVSMFGGRFEVSFAGQNLKEGAQVMLAENDYGTIFHISKEQGNISQSLLRISQ